MVFPPPLYPCSQTILPWLNPSEARKPIAEMDAQDRQVESHAQELAIGEAQVCAGGVAALVENLGSEFQVDPRVGEDAQKRLAIQHLFDDLVEVQADLREA